MKIRIIKKPQYVALHHVQKKVKWWPFWITVDTGSLKECQTYVDNLMQHGNTYAVLFEGETNEHTKED